MDSLSSVSQSIVLQPNTSLRHHHHHYHPPLLSFSNPTNHIRLLGLSYTPESYRGRFCIQFGCKFRSDEGDEEEERRRDEEVERALHMEGTILWTSNEFVKAVPEANPWRETSKPVYMLTHRENQLCTMKTRRKRSEVETELGVLFSRGGKSRNSSKQSGTGTKFRMLVEDVREGILVLEDENEAGRYCDLLQGGGQDCEGVMEIEASLVFDLWRKVKALAVLFRRGSTPPLPESLKLNLGARKLSLEDQNV